MKRLTTTALLLLTASACVEAPAPADTETSTGELFGRHWRPFPPPTSYDATVPRAWFELAVELTRTTSGFTPPIAARAFGYMGLTAYEAVAPGLRNHDSLVGRVNGLDWLPKARGRAYRWPLVVNAALAEVARGLYGGETAQAADNVAAINALEDELEDCHGWTPRGIERRSKRLGRALGAAIFEYSKSDGGHEAYLRNFPTDYTPPVGPGLWEPTPPAFSRALLPYWGQNRPFALDSGAQCDPGPPPEFSTEPGSDFYEEAITVYKAVNNLTPEQRTIAEFWSDDPGDTATPPGHSIAITNIVIDDLDASLAVAAEAYARIGMSVADAFIAGWWTKYEYNLLRPITYIHDYIDPNWGPLPLVTPPFPEYTSGHSVQSGAAAEALTTLFGAMSFTDTSNVDRGMEPREFDSFYDFAREAAISRLYGGIHYPAAIDNGVEQGSCVGAAVAQLFGDEECTDRH